MTATGVLDFDELAEPAESPELEADDELVAELVELDEVAPDAFVATALVLNDLPGMVAALT